MLANSLDLKKDITDVVKTAIPEQPVKHLVNLSKQHEFGTILKEASVLEGLEQLVSKRLHRLLVIEPVRDEKHVVIAKKVIGVVSEVCFLSHACSHKKDSSRRMHVRSRLSCLLWPTLLWVSSGFI